MLAVLHHLLVSEQVPLEQILAVSAQLTRKWLVIEYVDPADPMFQTLTRGRGYLYQSLDVQKFLKAADEHFEIVDSLHLAGSHRHLFLMSLRHPLQ